MLKRINIPLLLASIILCQSAGLIGTIFTFSAIPTWYATLNKPFFSPPNYVFGPVWTTLYLLMGFALYIVWVSKNKYRGEALKIFFIQLILNALWSIIFFGLKSPALAFFEIGIMWVAIFLTIKAFAKVSKLSSYLLYPYLAWVSFAGTLNLAIWLLN